MTECNEDIYNTEWWDNWEKEQIPRKEETPKDCNEDKEERNARKTARQNEDTVLEKKKRQEKNAMKTAGTRNE